MYTLNECDLEEFAARQNVFHIIAKFSRYRSKMDHQRRDVGEKLDQRARKTS